MRTPLVILLIFLLCLGVMVVAPSTIGSAGYILIAMGDMRLEMTVVGAVIIVIALGLVLFFGKSLLGYPLRKSKRLWTRIPVKINEAATRARLEDIQQALDEGNIATAKALLAAFPDNARKHPDVIDMTLRVLAVQGQWRAVQQQLGQHKKRLGARYSDWVSYAALGIMAELASKEGALAVTQYWQNLPRKLQKTEEYRFAYAEQLLAQGKHEDAERHLVTWQSKKPSQRLYPLFAKLRLTRPYASMRLIESWIKQNPQQAEYYSLLGHLAIQARDDTLARNALNKAISLRPSRQDMRALAAIEEQQGNLRQAIELLKRSLSENHSGLSLTDS